MIERSTVMDEKVEFSKEKIKPFLDKVHSNADRIMQYFILGYAVIALILPIFHEELILGVAVSGASVGLYFLIKNLLPGSMVLRVLTSILLWNFPLLFILQMHGTYEVHFFYFISLTALLFYEDWRLLIPTVSYAVISVIVIFTLKSGGSDVGAYLDRMEHYSVSTAVMHILLLLIYAALCIFWAELQRKQTVKSAIDFLQVEDKFKHMKANIDFAEEISKGNLNTEYQFGDTDDLGKSLMNMQNSLLDAAERERKERYINVGLASIGEILRENAEDLKTLCDNVIENLVSYTKANQGGLFILERNESEEDDFLELIAARAFDRQKFMTKRFDLGEGLVGQAAIEKKTIYMTDVPQDYVNIKSGLGGANPGSVLIVPLKSEEEVLGVIELASFEVFSETDIEFLEKVGESIAATIITAKNNEKTKKLLENSNVLTEQLQAQEEEMRQNMEEMKATQEEMGRAQKELSEKEANLNALINNTDDTIFAIDKNYVITIVNKVLSDKYKSLGVDLSAGTHIMEALPEEVRGMWKERYDRSLGGEKFTIIDERGEGADKKYVETYHFPIRDEGNAITGVAVMSKDITEKVSTQQEIARKETNLNALINNTSDSIIMIDTDYKVTVINDVVKARYKGTQYEGLDVGSNALDMLGSVKDEWKGYYDRAFNGEKMNFTIKSSVEGEDSYRDYFINPVEDDKGEIIGVSVFSRDVTDKHKVQAEFANKSSILNSLVNEDTDTYFAIDADYNITIVNEVLKERFRASGIELNEGDHIIDKLPKESRDIWKERYERALKGESFVIPQERAVGNKTLHIVGHYGPIKDEEGKVVGAFVISKDVTDQKMAVEKAERLMKEITSLKNRADNGNDVDYEKKLVEIIEKEGDWEIVTEKNSN
ncbi:MAG: PAS domain-containing protein [Bacteroidota bacterium]